MNTQTKREKSKTPTNKHMKESINGLDLVRIQLLIHFFRITDSLSYKLYFNKFNR